MKISVRINSLPRFIEVLGGIMLGAGLALAQVATGTISGTVRDSSGAVVAAATVTATNRDTGLVRTVTSGPDGHYQLSSLPVGIYDLRAEAVGFQTRVQQGLNLSVGAEAVMNFTMSVGAVQETVTVNADAPLLDTTTASLGGLVNERQVTELPLNGRSFNSLALLETGVTVQHPVSPTSTTFIGLAFSSNGATVRSNYLTLDGTDLTEVSGQITGISSSGLMLGVDAIREFRLITNNPTAEYGMKMGSQMVIVSKGGTNQFHGTAFDFLRNSTLDARDFFAQTNPPFRRNNFGGTLGGPFRKDKDFFFIAYEGVRELLGAPLLLNVPNQLARTNGGLVPQIAPSAVPYLNLYPLPNGVLANDPAGRNGVGTFAYSFNQTTVEDFGQARMDHNFSERDQLFARYTGDNTRKALPNGNNPPQFSGARDTSGQFVTLSENHTISASVLNMARLAYTRPFLTFTFNVAPGTENLKFLPDRPAIGTVNPGSGVTNVGGGAPIYRGENSGSFSDDLSWVKGKHALKFGTLINRYRAWIQTATNYNGTWTFASLPDFLRGNPQQLQINSVGSVTDRTRVWNTFGFYVQDGWRATSRLTLDIGLRYEFSTSLNEVTGKGSSVRDILRDTAPTLSPELYVNPSLRNFGPRFGFAWDVLGNGMTAIRGGFSVLYDINAFLPAADIANNATPPFSAVSTINNGLCFPACTAVPTVTAALARSGTVSLRTIEYRQAQPHLLSYNLTVQRQFFGSMVLSVGYAGSRGLNLIQTVEGNPLMPEIVGGGTHLGGGTKFWTTNAVRQNAAWAFCECKTSGGDTWYNSLQLRLQRRLSRNLQFQTSYTFSKLIDTTQGLHGGEAGGSVVTGTDPFNLKTDKGLADYHDPHYFSFNALYSLPSAEWKGVARLLSGWRIGTILSLNSGLPFAAYLSSNRSRSGVLGGGANNADRPDLVPGCKLVLGGPDRYFDPACFRVQAAGFLGNAGRNIMTGPSHATWDFSLTKDIPIPRLGEAGSLGFRAEFFNLLNHPDFNIPTNGRTVYTATGTSATPRTPPPLSTAGQISNTVSPARQIQFALKLIF